MAGFVHVTDERLLRDIRRASIKPSKRQFSGPPGWPNRYVSCAPVLRDADSTFHWMREIAGPGRNRRGVAVQFRRAGISCSRIDVFLEQEIRSDDSI